MKRNDIAIFGSGAWGTALSIVLNDNNQNVTLYVRNNELLTSLLENNENRKYLPGVQLDSNIKIKQISDFDSNIDIIVNTIPTQFIKQFFVNNQIPLKDQILVNCSKGIEFNSHYTISQIFENYFKLSKNQYVNLSGPSHAEEVSEKTVTLVVAASENVKLSKEIQKIFNNNYFRVYSSNDVIGTEIGGALKNVIAVAAGIIDGLKLGDNTKAALITRGLAEISRLGIEYNANPLTFSGLTGLGDLYVTCSSIHSRNRKLGQLIGEGNKIEDIFKNNSWIAEGYFTAKSAFELAKSHNIDLPITEQVYNVLYENKNPIDALNDLVNRSLKQEIY